MPSKKDKNLSSEQKEKIEEYLLFIFSEMYLNRNNIQKVKEESDKIAEKIRDFILQFSLRINVNEADLLMEAKEKGLELVENHELIFFEKKVSKTLRMRAFLIPGIKIDVTDENSSEKVTEDDLQSVDHELCISFKQSINNKFIKLGNLLDLRATLVKNIVNKGKSEIDLIKALKNTKIFQESLDIVLDVASQVL